MGLGTVIIIGVVVGLAFSVYMEVDQYKSVKKQNPGASGKQIFSKYMDANIEDGKRRKKERCEEAQRRNERYLERVKTQVALNGGMVYHENGDSIYYTDIDGHSYVIDKKNHYVTDAY